MVTVLLFIVVVFVSDPALLLVVSILSSVTVLTAVEVGGGVGAAGTQGVMCADFGTGIDARGICPTASKGEPNKKRKKKAIG